ncbi:hypothetical protein EDD22DRAFT_847731 [Suillus occidentalis]|nr:hypothetical protein EDD22DRAFT_847731 [Suillus occidentalis]
MSQIVFRDQEPTAQRPRAAGHYVSAFSKIELWHSDVTYEIKPPSATSLKLVQSMAVNRSEAPGMQTYLEGLAALYSVAAHVEGSHAAGVHVRREPIETVHPVVRVHPVVENVDFQPQTCHALGASPHGEKPESVEEERWTDRVAEDHRIKILKEQGIEIPRSRKSLSRAHIELFICQKPFVRTILRRSLRQLKGEENYNTVLEYIAWIVLDSGGYYT